MSDLVRCKKCNLLKGRYSFKKYWKNDELVLSDVCYDCRKRVNTNPLFKQIKPIVGSFYRKTYHKKREHDA